MLADRTFRYDLPTFRMHENGEVTMFNLKSALGVRLWLTVACLACGALNAQRAPAGIPLDVHQGLARTDATGITFCIDQREPDWPLQVDIAQAIADALILEARFYYFGPDLADRVSDVDGMPDNLLFVLLDDHCDVFMGIRMHDRSVYPEFLTTTRAYMETGYVMAGLDVQHIHLDAFEADKSIKVGVSGDSAANVSLALFRPEVSRRVYPGEAALLEGLLNGEVTAAIFWEPALYGLIEERGLENLELHVRIADDLPASRWLVGAGLMSQQSFNRTSIDQAIEALTADGTLESALRQAGFREAVIFHD